MNIKLSKCPVCSHKQKITRSSNEITCSKCKATYLRRASLIDVVQKIIIAQCVMDIE